MVLDMNTLMISHLIIDVICASALTIIWINYRKRFPGILFWVFNTSLQAAASLLVFFGGLLSQSICMFFSNYLIVLGAVLLLIGLKKFIGNRNKNSHIYILLGIFTALFAFFTLIKFRPDIGGTILMVMLVIINILSFWVLVRKSQSHLRDVTAITAIVFGAYIAVSFTRLVISAVFSNVGNIFFESGMFDSNSSAVFLLLSTSLSISLIVMANKRLLRDIKVQEEKYTVAFRSTPYAITLIKLNDDIIIEVNDGFENMTGYQSEEVVGKSTTDINLWAENDDRLAVVTALNNDEIIQNREILFRKKSGEIFTGLYSSSKVTIDGEDCAISIIGDISEISEMKKKLETLASHDVLTGLPNRILFQERFNLTLAYAQRNNKSFFLVSLDLDNFKNINDTYGHEIGDKTLIEIAKRLNKLLRKSDTVARFGGDEFMLLISDIASREDADNVLGKILDGMNRPLIIDDLLLNVTSSLGVARYPEDGDDMNELLKKSDKALYNVKENGRANFKFYSEI